MFEKVLLSAYGKFPMIPFSRKKVLDVLYGNSLSSFLGHFVVKGHFLYPSGFFFHEKEMSPGGI